MIDLYEKGKAKFDWWQDWRGECVAIVAAGPSANKVGVEKLKERMHVIVINESYQLCPWADILYGCDAIWWHQQRFKVKDFKGIKIVHELAHQVKEIGVTNIKIAKTDGQHFIHKMLYDEPGVIGSGGNSGFQSLNLATQFGGTGIALIGFDYSEHGGIHWHGGHVLPLQNPDNSRFHEWRRWMGLAAPLMKVNGIDVVNCSLTSSLECFPKVTIDQMLRRWSL